MAKADLTKDYYADLELLPGAAEADIKKQFKKLALKYHPDRNPGREEEVNSKFQTIQAAHEVLTDPEQRAKYDSGRSRGSRQPGFGGGSTFQTGGHQRGNPYSNAGSYWPPPPKPPPAKKAAPASAGAQRYAGFAQTGAGPSKREQDSAQARQKTYEAWENMRKKKPEPAREWTPPKPVPKEYTPQSGREESNSYRHSAPPKPRPGYEEFVPGPSPSRTQSTFRKNGYMPSNSGGDEPAAASASAYYTRAVPRPPTARVPDPPPRAAPIPVDPLKQFREKTGTPLEPRISTPYATHGGERTNPFESANLNRSKSTRENMDKGDPFSGSSDRHRSASPNRSKSQTHLAPEFGQTRAGSETHLGSPPKRFYSHASGGPKPTDGSRANDQYTNVEIDTSSSEDSSPEQKGESFGTRPRAYAKRRNARPTSQTAPVSKTATGEANASTSKPTLAEFRRWWSSDQPEGPEGYEKEILRNTPADGPGSRNPPDESKEDPKLYALSSNPFKFGTARSSTLPTVSEEPPIQKSPCPHSTFVPTSLFPTTSSGDFDVKWPYLFRGTSRLPDYGISDVPSGASLRHTTSLNAFESTQFDILDQLVSRNASNPTSNRGKPCRDRGVEPCSSDHITQEARGFLRKEVPKASSYLPGNPSLSERQDCLSSSSRVAVTSSKKPKFGEPSLSFPEKTGQCYNSDKFSFNVDHDTFSSTRPPPSGFTSSSAENISTTFTPEDWHGKFQAGDYFGGSEKDGPLSRSGSGPRYRSPGRRRPVNKTGSASTSKTNLFASVDSTTFDQPNDDEQQGHSPGETKFSPDKWAETFKPQTFAPPDFPSPGTRPGLSKSSRRTRTGSSTNAKTSTTKATGGSTAYVGEESSDEPIFMGERKSGGIPFTAEPMDAGASSPNAMDIDPPIDPQLERETHRQNGFAAMKKAANEARNVPVEPSRPEWRSHDTADSVAASAEPKRPDAILRPAEANKSKRRTTKSTDSEDFRTNFEDLKNVEPLHNPVTGLNSFSDLKSTLPFTSTASTTVPISRGFSGTLDLPLPPKAPALPSIPPEAVRPSATSWQSYLAAFKAYMVSWDVFNTQMISHFVARKSQVSAFPAGWLEAFGESGVDKYREGLDEDEKVMAWWTTSQDKHRNAMSEFVWMREVMKGGINNVPARGRKMGA